MKRIIVATISLLFCLVLLVSASLAWIALSRAPEISGIETQIGANGSLEIALVTDETFIRPDLIRSAVGSSAAVQEETVSNLTWGNVVDLSDGSYGLNEISLLPARLNVLPGEETAGVSGDILGTVIYGADGRVERENVDSVSAVYSEEGFIFDTETQHYGVRGIGTVSNSSVQQTAMVNARAMVRSHEHSALTETEAAWSKNGSALIALCSRHVYQEAESVLPEEVAVLRNMAIKAKSAVDHIDLALRQGIIGYASASIEDEEAFRTMQSAVENTSIPLSILYDSVPQGLPSGFSQWIKTIDMSKQKLQQAIVACNAFNGAWTWVEAAEVLSVLVDVEKAYLGDHVLASPEAYKDMGADNEILLAPGSGVFSDIAAYCGNYSVLFTYEEPKAVEVKTAFSGETAHLDWITAKLDDSEALGDEEGPLSAPIEEVYGYAIDVAFRCNQESDLLLQTEAISRQGGEAASAQTLGGGSYMEFTSEELGEEQMVPLEDAIRIGFVNGKNSLVAVAKPGTNDYVFKGGVLTVPLWLYEFEVSDGGSILMGERRMENCAITALPDDTPITITAVIWLDGEFVYNSYAAIDDSSMSGVLNLQFASSAELDPADIIISVDE